MFASPCSSRAGHALLHSRKSVAALLACTIAGLSLLDQPVMAHDNHHSIEDLFAGATILAGPNLVDCTLSGGTATRCFSITVKSEPATYTPGPWCPRNVSDDSAGGGIWLEGGGVFEVDGQFIKNMGSFYNDSQWQLFDSESGKIRVTDTLESCRAAARPNVDPAYRNYCVECLPEYMGDDASVTYTIPLNPVPGEDRTFQTRASGSGVAVNGVRLDGPAPVEAILGNYTLAPFDDCGGHVNLAVGYHYHAATDCLSDVAVADDHGQVIGVAMDGYLIMARKDNTGEVPTDLDSCGGHVVDGTYHYHAGAEGSNAILSCLTGEAGCVSGDTGESCDASKSANDGPQGGGVTRPDFAAAAKALGITEAKLLAALGGPPPDFDKAAAALGISVDKLRELLPTPDR